MTGFFGIGIGELILILLLAFLAFGPGKLPEIARGLGKAVRQFSKYSSSLTNDFRNEFEKELDAPASTGKEDTTRAREMLKDSTGDLTKAGSSRP